MAIYLKDFCSYIGINKAMNDQVVLGYWHSRGRGEVARQILAYSGVTWNNVTYTQP